MKISYKYRLYPTKQHVENLESTISLYGTQIENPKHLSKSETKLAEAQRALSKKREGTRTREKVRIRVAKIHRKIANQRKDFLHKVSRKIVDAYDIIAYEDLKIKNMMQICRLGMSLVPEAQKPLGSSQSSTFGRTLTPTPGALGTGQFTLTLDKYNKYNKV